MGRLSSEVTFELSPEDASPGGEDGRGAALTGLCVASLGDAHQPEWTVWRRVLGDRVGAS